MRSLVQLAARALCAGMMLGLVALAPDMGLSGRSLSANAQANFGQRVVNGVVLSADGGILTGATVFLRNTKNKSIRSYTTAADGHFRFAQVNMADDFDLWAEKDSKKSPSKTVSSWDSRKEVAVELRIK
jgi:Carboxypeptidase regulatory-like domain